MVDARAQLIEDARLGGVSLVLGAGVSRSVGLRDWKALASAVGKTCGVWPTLGEDEYTADFPQFLPFVFELAHERLGDTEKFIGLLRDQLYHGATPWDDPERLRTSVATLAVVARTIWGELSRGQRCRIERVVTFNVDDMIQLAVQRLAGDGSTASLQVISRASEHPRHGVGQRPIPIYHLHGYLPFSPGDGGARGASDTLVFMDAQYWASGANPLSFANRVMASALHDSHCLFVGCSMSDINILRWLGLRFNELLQDKRQQLRHQARDDGADETVRTELHQALGRHYWIRAETGCMAEFVSSCLELRGVRTVQLAAWNSNAFDALMQACFPDA